MENTLRNGIMAQGVDLTQDEQVRFIRGDSLRGDSIAGDAVCTDIWCKVPSGLQEAILRLSGVVNLEQLEEAVKDALEAALPNTSDVVVYLQSNSAEGQELVSSHGLLHTLPKEGLASEALSRRERLHVSEINEADPLSGLLKTAGSNLNSGRKVVVSPVEDKETDRVLAVLAIVCDELSKEDQHHLSFLEKQLVVCWRRLRHTAQLTGVDKSQNSSRASSITPANNLAILALCADLYDQDACSLQLKVLKYLISGTKSQTAMLLLVDLDHRELICQVQGETILQDELRMPIEENSFADIIKTKKPCTHSDLSQQHVKDLETQVGCRVDSLLAVPVLQKSTGQVVAIATVLNKIGSDRFTEEDVELIQHCFQYTAAVLHSTLAVQNEQRLKKQTQTLLQVARNLFSHLDNLTKLLREIMQEARNLTKAERCSVFLVEKETEELVAKVFDGDQIHTEIRIPLTQGIAGYVATTGEVLNIDDAYSHPLFYRGVDDSTGFRTRNILCFPIKDDSGVVIGVAQLCNKIGGIGFSTFDEEIAQAFSIYCCISIMHSLLYKKVQSSQVRSNLANELMIYHMSVTLEDVQSLTVTEVPPVIDFGSSFDKFTFTPRSVSYEQTPLAVFSMLEDMDFMRKFKVPKDQLARFVLMVRRGYRDPPYHNWAHAFSVAHFCYLLFKNTKINKCLDELELFALFIACLCHDIDHRGTTNSFQVSSKSALASLYSSEGSVMERHHFAQTMCILQTEGCNIFENLTSAEYERVLDLMRDIILATDLAHHLKIMKDLERMSEGGYDNSKKPHHMLLVCMMMTSCDLSDQTKNWQNTKKIAELIYQEFFSQGDMEKRFGNTPMEMMDREKAYIPKLQIAFLDSIALPLFRLVVKVFPEAMSLLDNVENNRKMWMRMNDKLQQLQIGANSMDIFELDLKLEVEDGSADHV